jgi:hypothetical protein
VRGVIGFSKMRGSLGRAALPPRRPAQRVRFRDGSPPETSLHAEAASPSHLPHYREAVSAVDAVRCGKFCRF